MKKPQKERCYLCLKEFDTKVMTDDHAPPKCIYPPGTPDRIYARACGPCNRSFMDDDNEFRNWLSTVASSSKSKKWIFDNKTVSSLKKDKRLLHNIQSRLSVGDVDLGGGEIARLPKCGYPADRTQAMFRRITKCLLTRFYPSYDYSNDAFLIGHMLLEEPQHRFAFWQTIAPLLIDHRGEDVFVFWRGVVDDGAVKNLAGVWVLLFYPDADLKGACFSVIHSHHQLFKTRLVTRGAP